MVGHFAASKISLCSSRCSGHPWPSGLCTWRLNCARPFTPARRPHRRCSSMAAPSSCSPMPSCCQMLRQPRQRRRQLLRPNQAGSTCALRALPQALRLCQCPCSCLRNRSDVGCTTLSSLSACSILVKPFETAITTLHDALKGAGVNEAFGPAIILFTICACLARGHALVARAALLRASIHSVLCHIAHHSLSDTASSSACPAGSAQAAHAAA